MSTLREVSKQSWNCSNSIQDINAGSLQRIADATELMAKNYVQLQNDLNYYKKAYFERGESINKYYKTISALRGQITKLKNKLNAQVSDTTKMP